MKLLRSRLLLPVTAPPIEDGAVLVSGGRIAALGRWRDLRQNGSAHPVDLGDCILFPGLINAHCHLDYTHLAGHLPPPRRFTDWIQGVLALKAAWSFSEFAASWLAGAGQLLRSGCTTVVDIESVPELLPEVWEETPLRVISALEMTGVRAARPPAEVLAETLRRADLLRHPVHRAALAPHAPYSTRPELLRLAGEAARRRGWLATLHVAESAEEFEMFRQARGRMFDWLQGQRDMSDCGGISPVRHALNHGMGGAGCLLAHVNYLDEGDAAALGRGGAGVVHCPRSHDYFGHAPFPYPVLRAAGVPVCLGTDSLLSVRREGAALPELDLRAELARFAAVHPGVAPEEILASATVVAARAIGRAGDLGEVREGLAADLVAIPFHGPVRAAAGAVVSGAGPVVASMIGGEWGVSPDGGAGGEGDS